MKKLNILALMHEDLVPPETMDGYKDKEIVNWKTEFDVITTLREMGHTVFPLGVYDDIDVIRKAILDVKPDIVFNMLEETHENSLYDCHIVSYLELLKMPYTGCNPRGLMLSHDKAISKKLFTYHGINTPDFFVIPLHKKFHVPKSLSYPLIAKSLVEDGSYGLSQASVVYSENKLRERVAYLQEKLETPVLVEEYIEGREIYITVMGNNRIQVFPALELVFGKMPNNVHKIATSKVKWDWNYQKRYKIDTKLIKNLSPQLVAKLSSTCKRIYRVLSISGYARIDIRLTNDDRIFVLEANANPDIAYGAELAESVEAAGVDYEQLLTKIINLGLRYQPNLARI